MKERKSERKENLNVDSLSEKSGWKAGRTIIVSQTKFVEMGA